jgi:glycosyltransferase involved in cell wall biosynthesis
MVDFTVAICTYNGEQRLPEVIEKLRSQEGIEDLTWEILVIDNNSTDRTAALVKEYISGWTKSYPLKYCFEAEQGLAFARRRGVQEANSELIGFLDDDNLPYPNWVQEAYKFGQEHPKAGAYSGQIHGRFAVPPPEGFERIAGLLALIEGKKTYCFNQKFQTTQKRVFPPGAGIVIRKKAWLETVLQRPKFPQIGEDVEFLSAMYSGGWQLWFNTNMHIEHVIPDTRLSPKYLASFLFKNGLYRYSLRKLNYQPWQQLLIIPPYAVNDLRKIILHIIKYNVTLFRDPIASAEMGLFWGSFLSPLFYWRKILLK